MKKIYSILALILQSLSLMAQSGSVTLKQVIKLEIPREGGANGASVAWHPTEKKYYAAVAGNTSYCLGVYDSKGNRLSPKEQETMFDVRGLWYNPSTKTLQMNGYKEFGWAEYKLNSKGLPVSVTVLRKGLNQPTEQSAGAFNSKENLIYFISEFGEVESYDAKTGRDMERIELKIGYGKNETPEYEDYEAIFNAFYNTTSIIYTGIKGAELGLWEVGSNAIELYNISTGYLTRTLRLPEGVPTFQWLNFSYANGIYFLFNKETRTWHGYK